MNINPYGTPLVVLVSFESKLFGNCLEQPSYIIEETFSSSWHLFYNILLRIFWSRLKVLKSRVLGIIWRQTIKFSYDTLEHTLKSIWSTLEETLKTVQIWSIVHFWSSCVEVLLNEVLKHLNKFLIYCKVSLL